jgi:hypothetical protein
MKVDHFFIGVFSLGVLVSVVLCLWSMMSYGLIEVALGFMVLGINVLFLSEVLRNPSNY